MAYNFQPLDFSNGIQYRQNAWDKLGNNLMNAGRAFDDFWEQKKKWDEIKEKKNKFQTGMRNIRTAMDADKTQLAGIDYRNQLKDKVAKYQEDLQTLGADRTALRQRQEDGLTPSGEDVATPGQENDDNWNSELQGNFAKITVAENGLNAAQKEYDELGGDVTDDEYAALSQYAQYMNNPEFELALQQAEQEESFAPIINFMTADYNRKFGQANFDWQKEQAAKSLAFQQSQLKAEADAAKQEGINAKLAYELDNKLSLLDGLNFGKDGKVIYGEHKGKTMQELTDALAQEYLPQMGEAEFYKTLQNNKTMSRYQKMLGESGSTRPKKRVPPPNFK